MLTLSFHDLRTADNAIQRGFIDDCPQARRIILIEWHAIVRLQNLLARHAQRDGAPDGIVRQDRPDRTDE
jgi:hypothetical protein